MVITAAQPTISRSHRPEDTLQSARRLLEQNQVEQAIALLEASPGAASSPALQAMLGAAYFRKEDYQAAITHYEKAHQLEPENPEYRERLEQAVSNQLSDVSYDPGKHPFNREVLLGAPRPGEVSEQGANHTPERGSLARRLAIGSLKVAGYAAGALIGGGIGLLARAFGQREEDEVWTTWSRKNYVKGLLTLAQMRYELDHNNLHDSYQAQGQLVGFVQPGMKAPEWTTWARTADGSWNNPENPKEGAAGTRFGRNVQPSSTVVDPTTLLDPNPREISRVLLTRDQGYKAVPFLNLMAASWIQFMVHDWVSHGENRGADAGFYEIPLASDDPVRQKNHMTHMFVPKTAEDPTRRPEEAGTPPTHVNEVTHWWDGSQIYGSDLETQKKLRSGQDGKMRLDARGNLPLGSDGVEETGFRRNWWLGLSMLHTLFVREHNDICDMLKKQHPDWSDERLFQVARLINAAQMAKIHTVEWTPAILPNRLLNDAMNANWSGAVSHQLVDRKDRKTDAPWEPTDHILGGIVGHHTDKFGIPFSLTEEFTAVYRLHSLLPDSLQLRKIGDQDGVEVPLGQTRAKASHRITDSLEMADLFSSFGTMQPGQLVLNNYPKTLQDLSIPGFAAYDLAAIDILRDRERGVPRYNEFRRQLQLNPITKFEDLTDDVKVVSELKRLYNNDIEKIDLLVGTLAESHRPEGFGFGETMFQVFILNASRRLQADRFFTTSYNAETYTPEGLKRIDQCTMKGLLLRHYPDLAATGLGNVENAFEPWDQGALDPARHPLASLRA